MNEDVVLQGSVLVRPFTAEGTTRSSLRGVWLPGLAMWLLLWVSQSSGPWLLRSMPIGLLGWLHAFRAAWPLFALVLSLGVLAGRGRVGWPISGPARAWLVYGCIGALACLNSPTPSNAAYWAAAYLAAFVTMAAALHAAGTLTGAANVNRAGWLTAFAILLVMLVVARDALFVGEGLEMSGYGVSNRAEPVAGVSVSIASGMARFAAIPGIVSLAVVLLSRWRWRWLGALPVLASGVMVYLMQSRGAIIAYAFTMVFMFFLAGARSRWLMVCILIMLAAALVADAIPEVVIHHLMRAEQVEDLKGLTGRTRDWQTAWEASLRSPIWGWGPQADRFFCHQHVHNTYMYVLLEAGFAGLAAFVVGMVWMWLQFWRVMRTFGGLARSEQIMLLQVGGILAFFTVRGIPEVSGAFFSVDLLLMLPAVAYLDLLHSHRDLAIASSPGSSARQSVWRGDMPARMR